MQGLPAGFALTALANFLTAEHVAPSKVGSFAAIVGLPWAFQFIWGPFIDRYQQSAMGRRKPWVLGAQLLALLASFGLLSIRNPTNEVHTLGMIFMIHSIFASVQDASVDAMAITVIPSHERGRLNAFMRAGFLVGTGVGAAVFSHLLRHYSFGDAALIQSICLLTLTLLTFFIREQPSDRLLPFLECQTPILSLPAEQNQLSDYTFKWLFEELIKGIFARRNILLFAAIIAAYVSISLFLRSYNYHLIQKLGWADTSLSLLTGTFGMVVATVAALVSGYLADQIGPPRLLVIVLLVMVVYLIGFNLLESSWKNPTVAQTGLVALYFMDPGLSAAAMPLLMAICRPGVEGSQFTTYMAFVNLSDIAGSYLTGHAVAYTQAPVIGLVAGALAGLALIVIWSVLHRYNDLPSIR